MKLHPSSFYNNCLQYKRAKYLVNYTTENQWHFNVRNVNRIALSYCKADEFQHGEGCTR